MSIGRPIIEDFDRIYGEYSDAIFRHIYYRLQDRERALDLTQEVFGRFWQYLQQGNKVDNPKAFLYRSAGNAFINEIRGGRKRDVSLEKLADDGFDIKYEKAEIEELAVQREIVERLQKMDDRYRDILVMRYIDDMQVKEIAELMGKSENNISVRIRRGLKKLRENYERTR